MSLFLLIWGISLISQLGKHFWPAFSFVGGLPIDYLSPTVYLSEILSFVLVLCLRPRLFRLPKPLHLLWLLPAANIILALKPELALIYWLRVFLIGGVAFSLIRIRPKYYIQLNHILKISICIIFVLVLGQLINQGSLGGLWYWLGERQFDLLTPGVAKIILWGKIFLRPYGSFSHPNSLAGFALVFLIIVTNFKNKIGDRGRIFWQGLAVLLIILSASRVAILGTVIFWGLSQVRDRGLAGKLSVLFLFTSLLISLATISVPPNPQWGKSVNQRLVLAQTTIEAINQRPVLGWGGGNTIAGTYQVSSQFRFNLWYQPVHNLWLLLLVETGVVGLLLAVIGAIKLARILIDTELYWWWAGWLAILFTALFDHYWLTLPQNRLILAVFLGLSLRAVLGKIKKGKLEE